MINSRIYTEIKNCTNIFLTYSFNAKRVFTQLGKEYSHFYQFFAAKPTSNFRIRYFSPFKEYLILDCLAVLKAETSFIMFENHIIYTIHPASEQCSSVASEELPLTTQIQELLADYKRPKNPRIIIQLIRPFINDKMIVILPSKADKSIKIHLVDFSQIKLPLSPFLLYAQQCNTI